MEISCQVALKVTRVVHNVPSAPRGGKSLLTDRSKITRRLIYEIRNAGLARLVVTAGNKFGNVAQFSLAAPKSRAK
ncbi:hypothetical protein J6590_068766 [Homalodisca vitripennis]|nr:hypothetical protein J6590_068766 [Homalodisca vitripennis]